MTYAVLVRGRWIRVPRFVLCLYDRFYFRFFGYAASSMSPWGRIR